MVTCLNGSAKSTSRQRRPRGAPRIHVGVPDQGLSGGRKPVERHMRAAALLGVRHREGTRPTIRGDRVRLANDLVNRNFGAHAPDRPMVADITYGPTWAGFNRGLVVPGAGPRCIWAGQWATTSRCNWLSMPGTWRSVGGGHGTSPAMPTGNRNSSSGQSCHRQGCRSTSPFGPR